MGSKRRTKAKKLRRQKEVPSEPSQSAKEGMMTGAAKRIPIKEGLWTVPSSPHEKPQLIGSRCPLCGEVFFPKKGSGICTRCQSRNLEEIKLSRRGKIYSFTVVMQRPPEYYKGPVPYAEGFVELPEGVRVETLFTDCNVDDLKVGMDVELVIEKLCEDEEGNEILAFKFRPVISRKGE
jgi:uncharacterized OB-fold protein